MYFHPNCGANITLSSLCRVAEKEPETSEDNLVFTGRQLSHEFKFFISLLRKNEDDGESNIKVGVTVLDPNKLAVLPKRIEDLHLFADAWWFSSDTIASNEDPDGSKYTVDLDSLSQGDSIGILRSEEGDLEYYVNGQRLGIAARNVPEEVFGVVDLCGQTNMICIYGKIGEQVQRQRITVNVNRETTSNLHLLTDMDVSLTLPSNVDTTHGAIPKDKNIKCHGGDDRLRFHKRTGSLVKLSASRRSAQRRHPLDEFNNGVVMSHRCLYDNELFEIRIDRLVDKWSGSIEVGVTTHNPGAMEFPATMTNMRSGTIMMSGCGILTNGRGTRREYGNYNLDQLQAGDRVGLARMSNGNLHYFINGNDQGVAATRVNHQVWGVVDLYGMTVKVTIVDPGEQYFEEPEEHPIEDDLDLRAARRRIAQAPYCNTHAETAPIITPMGSDILAFHSNCGTHAVVINNGQTAYRPYASDEFNNGVVLTNRPLKPDELFEVCLEEVVCKWAGSMEIGVTVHSPYDLEFPLTINDFKSGTWMMTSLGIMHNSRTVREHYATNRINQLGLGDRIGVMRQTSGVLRFFVNGVDQGPAVSGVPENIYGVIDLYGQAAQASIVQNPSSPDSLNSSASNVTLHGCGELAFHRICGSNVKISKHATTAHRVNLDETEDSVLVSCRPLRECEMFQIRIDNKLYNSKRTLAFGVATAFPLKPFLPSSAFELSKEVFLLDGDVLYSDYKKTRSTYPFSLDNVCIGSLLGVMRHADRSVHFYIDGIDHGKAWVVHSINVYAVLDLYGQCTQVSIIPPNPRAFGNSENSQMIFTTGSSQAKPHSFSEYCGSNIRMNADCTMASLKKVLKKGNLVFSSTLLKPDETFQVEIIACRDDLVGSMRVGVTDVNVLNAHINRKLPNTMDSLPPTTMYIDGSWVIINKSLFIDSVAFNLGKVRAKDTIGLRKIGHTDSIALIINSQEIGVVFTHVPHKTFAVFELCGDVVHIRAASVESPLEDRTGFIDYAHSLHLIESLDAQQPGPSGIEWFDKTAKNSQLSQQEAQDANFFDCHHGSNIQIDKEGKVVKRISGYNEGLLIVNQPIRRGQSVQFTILKTNQAWSGSLMVGAGLFWVPSNPPSSAVNLPRGFWIVASDHIYLDGLSRWSDYGGSLEKVKAGSKITILFSETSELHLSIDTTDYGPFVKIDPKHKILYPVVDVYGKCEQITIPSTEGVPVIEEIPKAETSAIPVEEEAEDKGCDEATGYDLTQQEKADMEYREKEFDAREFFKMMGQMEYNLDTPLFCERPFYPRYQFDNKLNYDKKPDPSKPRVRSEDIWRRLVQEYAEELAAKKNNKK